MFAAFLIAGSALGCESEPGQNANAIVKCAKLVNSLHIFGPIDCIHCFLSLYHGAHRRRDRVAKGRM